MEHLADSAVYGDRVVDLFDAPRHAGLPRGANLAGRAESPPRSSWVEIGLASAAGRVTAAGFRALGCPHTIAAADLVCEDLVGRGLDELERYSAAFLDDALPLPPEKIDIRILLEDAVRNAAAGGD